MNYNSDFYVNDTLSCFMSPVPILFIGYLLYMILEPVVTEEMAEVVLCMEIRKKAGKETLHYMDEPPREGVRPCANYMYESLQTSRFDSVVCAVMT